MKRGTGRPGDRTLSSVNPHAIEISLDAVIIAVTDGSPRVLTVPGPDGLPALPSGLLETQDRTLDTALRRWVREQAGIEVGYVEQLYTFGDRERATGTGRLLSVAYLALVAEEKPSESADWRPLYEFFPWEDHRNGRPAMIDDQIVPALAAFGARSDDPAAYEERAQIVFGTDDTAFDGVRVLERYELLYESGLLEKSPAATRVSPGERPPSKTMALDHRRIVATAFGRLRGKLTYRPVVFELLPSTFTLLQLQRLVEALAGTPLHKQNFRRLVEAGGLVEGTGEHAQTGGRPAELFRFRREVLRERPRPGVGSPWIRP